MSDAVRRIFVRLVSEGGRELRAELEGIGETGAASKRKLRAEVDAASESFDRFAARVEVAAAAGIAALAATAAAAVRSSLQLVDAQAKSARSLGTTVESLQVLDRAASLSGISLDQVTRATEEMTRRLSQAAAGGGPAAAALDRLRLSAAELLALPLDQRLRLVQERLAAYVPEAERAAVMSELFGRRAGLMMERLDSAALETATRDVRDFGVAVSDLDAAQIERTNDALSRLGLIWRGLANRLAVEVAPGLERTADRLAEIARVTGPVGRALSMLIANIDRVATAAAAFALMMGTRYVARMAFAAGATLRVVGSLEALRIAFLRFLPTAVVIGLGEVIARLTGLTGAGADAREAVWRLNRAIADQATQLGILAPAVADGTRMSLQAAEAKLEEVRARRENILAMIAEYNAQVALTPEYRALSRQIDDVTLRLRALANTGRDGGAFAPQANRADIEFWRRRLFELGDQRAELLARGDGPDALREVDALIGRIRTAIDNAEDGVVRFGDGVAPVIETTERLGGAVRKLGEAPVEAAQGWDLILERLATYAEGADRIAGEIGDALVGAFRGAEDAVARFVREGKLSMRDFVGSVMADLARLATRRFITAPLAGMLGSALSGMGGSWFASVLHAGGIAGAPGPARAVPAGVFSGAERFHGGGWPGLRPGEVPAILERGERVLSRREAQGYGAAPVTVHIHARDAESFRAGRTQIAADIARAVQRGRRGL